MLGKRQDIRAGFSEELAQSEQNKKWICQDFEKNITEMAQQFNDKA
jgi:hypothetical protein